MRNTSTSIFSSKKHEIQKIVGKRKIKLEGLQLETLSHSLQNPHLAPKSVRKTNKTMLREKELLTM